MPRDRVVLECGECRERNYMTSKNKHAHPERVERRKHCPRCNRHTAHRETR